MQDHSEAAPLNCISKLQWANALMDKGDYFVIVPTAFLCFRVALTFRILELKSNKWVNTYMNINIHTGAACDSGGCWRHRGRMIYRGLGRIVSAWVCDLCERKHLNKKQLRPHRSAEAFTEVVMSAGGRKAGEVQCLKAAPFLDWNERYGAAVTIHACSPCSLSLSLPPHCLTTESFNGMGNGKGMGSRYT